VKKLPVISGQVSANGYQFSAISASKRVLLNTEN